ncbi:MAG: RHS repeat-associated core domain-containing protein [Pseudomonadota bacterium]
MAEGTDVAGGPGVPIPVEDYAYDEEGNRTASHLSAFYTSNAHNQLTEDDTYLYTYDLKGNRISRTEKSSAAVETYTYDSQNRLIGYTSPTTTATYHYDALDRRIAKTVDGVTTAYTYDMSEADPLAHDDIVLEWDTTDPAIPVLARRWVHSNSIDEPVGFETYTVTSGAGSGDESLMYADRQGSVIWVTDPATGAVEAAYEYDGYGAITQTLGELQQPYGYTGREYDAEIGLYFYRARHYDPTLGRFVQRDPIGFAGGSFNLFAYAGANPFVWSDPSRLAAAVECGAGRASGGPCGTQAGSASGVMSAVATLARRLVHELATASTVAMSPPRDDNIKERSEDSPECKAARRELERAQQVSKDAGGSCTRRTTFKKQRDNWKTPEVQFMLFRRLMALHRVYSAREYRDLVCHGGSDEKHQKELLEVEGAIRNCVDALDHGTFRR